MRRVIQRRFAVISFMVLVFLGMLGAPAFAQEPGSYAHWSVSGGSGAWTGTGMPAAGFPVATMTSNATNVTVPSGASAFVGPGTPIGAAYGSSLRQNYLNVATAAGGADSTTTLTFATPTPAGKWAFALGDIDADRVKVTAADDAGAAIPTAALGFQDVFNYCDVSPKPTSCVGPGPFTDLPTWNEGTSTLVGNTLDTVGAAGWFEPTAAVKTLTFTFSKIIGFPVFQIWLATKSVPVSTVVEGVTETCPATLELDDPSGEPILGADGSPVQAKTAATGEVSFPAVTDGSYIVHLVDSDCGTIIGPENFPIEVDTDEGPVVIPPGTFKVFVHTLPATGDKVLPHLFAAVALVAAGAVLYLLARRRRRAIS